MHLCCGVGRDYGLLCNPNEEVAGKKVGERKGGCQNSTRPTFCTVFLLRLEL